MIKIIVNGFYGNMGKVVCQVIKKDPSCEVIAGIDYRGRKLTEIFPSFIDINNCDIPANVVIDFSTATAVPKLLDFCERKNLPLVLCTTGLDNNTLNKINLVSKKIPIFKSSNMSIGINLISTLLKNISKILYNYNFDIEILEKHHNTKIDSPSGTALLLAQSINYSIEKNLKYTYDRSKIRSKRNKNEIGIHSIRGGTIIGDHSVIFAGNYETIEIKHSALSRKIFAVGSVNAAKYIIHQKPGIYNMEDLVNNSLKIN